MALNHAAFELTQGYVPGCIGRVAELHARYYAREWNFPAFFEAKVASEMAEFVNRYDGRRDALWTVSGSEDGRIEGSITIDGIHADADGAHLRWFIMSDALRGQGFGHRLIDAAVGFCRGRGYRSIYLSTFSGLHAAARLYQGAGFELVHEAAGVQWGSEVREQHWALAL